MPSLGLTNQTMGPESLNVLARYNGWVNDKLYGLAAKMTDEERRRDRGAFFKSIHGTFNHLLVADRIWLARFKAEAVPDGFMGPEIRSLDQELFRDFERLRRERERTDAELSAWVAKLSGEQLLASFAYKRRGQRHEHPLWWAVAHVFNHQTHHRGQLTTLFTQSGVDPGATDLIAMLWDEAADGR
jgi:uncharacterized damage-inducible protein DinB